MRSRLVAIVTLAAWGATPAARAADDAGAPGVPEGVYWVRRAGGRCGQGPTSDGGVRLTGATTCAPVSLKTEGGGAALTLPLEGLTLHLSRARGAWTIDAVSLRRGKPEVGAREFCRQPLHLAETDGGLRTELGTLFAEEAACDRAPGYTVECPPGGCEEAPDTMPLTLGGCEAARGRLEAKTAPLRDRDEDATLASMTRLRALAAKGGSLWTRPPASSRCAALAARPASPGVLELVLHFVTPEGERVVSRATYSALSPLRASARRESSQEERVDAEGTSRGGSGSGGGVPVGLFVGDQAVLLDERLLFFTRAACDAHAAQPAFRSPEARCLERGLRQRVP